MLRQVIKRAFDFVASLILLIGFSPIFLFAAIMVWLKMGRPVFFCQDRPGLRGKPFKMIKFRTMTNERDADGNLLPDGDRLPKIGRILRATSIDELPELINVLKGDMSLVGPRPLLMRYLDRYSEEQLRRHEVRPGITGWAQVNGRNAIGWEERFKLDVWYVDHQGFFLDISILWRTIFKVFKREGISQEGQATMEEFMGNALKS